MSIVLTRPVSRGTDPIVEIRFVGISYNQNRVIVRLAHSPSGIERDFVFTQGAGLAQLVANVPQFAGLRVALLQYLQSLDADLAGSVS